MAALAAAYHTSARIAETRTVTDDTMTTRPQPDATIPGSTARVTRKDVSRLRARERRQSAVVIAPSRPPSLSVACGPSVGLATLVIPALLTSTVGAPRVLVTCFTR